MMNSYFILYYHSNKNYFFERFKFLNNLFFNKIYLLYFFLKGMFVPICIFGISYWYNDYSYFLALLPILLFIFKLFTIDSRKWAHFYRNDWISAFPIEKQRYIVILFSNLIIDFIVEDNILLLIIYQLIFIKPLVLLGIYVSLILIYLTTVTFQLVLLQSNLFLKKIYSFLIYIISCITTTYVFFIFINAFISLINYVIQRELVLENILYSVKNYIFNLFIVYENNQLVIIISSILIFIINFYLVIYLMQKNKFENSNQYTSQKISDFIILRLMYYLYKKLKFKRINLFYKELGVISELYTFNYKEYFYTFFCDRSFFILISLILTLYKYYNPNFEIVFIPIFTLFYFLDNSSSINVKLMPNLSFVSDYSVISIMKSTQLDLNELLNIKIILFRFSRVIGLISYFILLLVCTFVFKLSIMIVITSSLLLILFWIFLPKILFTNNLIYIRQNYPNFNQFIEDYNFIMKQSKDFFIINWFYNLLTIWLVFTLISSNFSDYFQLISFVNYFISILVIALLLLIKMIMQKIKNNIYSFLEDGDYSVDISKIFKKSN